MNRFENKIIIITGAAGGIGASTTRRIVSEGGKVVIADYSREKADQFAAELSNSGADVRPVYFSATELKSCKELITFTMKEYGQIDVLVNNVGGTNPRRDTNIETLDMDYFDEAFHLNLSCTMYFNTAGFKCQQKISTRFYRVLTNITFAYILFKPVDFKFRNLYNDLENMIQKTECK